MRAELKSLPTDLAAIVGAHLGAAGDLIVEDPARALRHARAARRMASRLTVTREALGEAAYAAGEWSEALNEFRALRRMTGDQVWLPVMADCERALGRPQAALRLAREAQEVSMHARDRVELHIVEAGARADLGQVAEARRLLRRTLESVPAKAVGSKVRAGYALAERLLADGDRNEAREIFRQVAGWDRDHATDAAERCDELDGMVLDLAPEEAGDQP